MKIWIVAMGLLAPAAAYSQAQTAAEIQQIQSQPKPPYCEEPVAAVSSVPGGTPALPQYPTLPTVCYKIQVAILRNSNPFNFHFHPSLVARWRPCEEVWVVESKDIFCNRQDAERYQQELKELGYEGTFITQLVTYQ